MEKIETYNGQEVHNIIGKKYGARFLKAFNTLQESLEKEMGKVQIISEEFFDEKGNKGLGMMVNGEKGIMFLRLKMDIFGEITVESIND